MFPINPQMQISEPQDCCGAWRSERSFDGVKFKRIIMVFWGNENWNRGQAESLWSASVCLLRQRALWFHCSASSCALQMCSEFISLLSLPIQIHLIRSASPRTTFIVWVKGSKVACLISGFIHSNKTLLLCPPQAHYSTPPQACSWNSAGVSALMDELRPLKIVLGWPQQIALTECGLWFCGNPNVFKTFTVHWLSPNVCLLPVRWHMADVLKTKHNKNISFIDSLWIPIYDFFCCCKNVI